MKPPRIATREEWLEARRALLEKEKAFTRERDRLSAERRELPWVQIDKPYEFDTEGGPRTLPDLFGDKKQLVVYHFMFGADWEEGCKSCSFWADNFEGIVAHLAARDTAFVIVSLAPLEKLLAFKKRMGWTFPWVSSAKNEFNRDFGVSFTKEERDAGKAFYNFKAGSFPSDEAPGLSVFARSDEGGVFHTYSVYSRGIDILNGAYNVLDMTPLGRHEEALSYPMAWVRHHDRYPG